MSRFALTLASVIAVCAQRPLFAAEAKPVVPEKPAAAAAATRPASAEQRLAAVERQLEALLREVRLLREEAAAAAAADSRSILVIRLQNARAATSAEILKELFQRAAVDVAVDDRTNSLVVSGGAAGLADVRAALARLDAAEKKP